MKEMEYHLLRKGRFIFISPVPVGDIVFKLVQSMSYVKKSSKFMPNPAWGHVCLYDKIKGRFPVGLTQRVVSIFKKSGLNVFYDFVGVFHVDVFDSYKGLRPYQVDALNVMFKNEFGIIKMPTGSGKTRVATKFIDIVNKKTLVLVPTLDLVRQWEKQVGSNVRVKTYASIKKKAYVEQFEVVIFDECHHVAAKTLYRIGMNVSGDALLYGFSATPLNRDEDNLKVEAVLGPIIYEISMGELVDKGFLVPAKVYYHKVSRQDFKFITYADVYNEYVVLNEERNNKICELAFGCEKPCLILINRIEHGSNIFMTLKDMNVDVVFLNGQLKKIERDDVKHDVIVATGIYDEGVDLPDMRTLIIGAGGRSAIKASQRVGRVLRPYEDKEFAVVHDFADDCKWLRGHYFVRRKIFESDFEVFDVD